MRAVISAKGRREFKSAVCQPGRIMFWSGRKRLGTCDLAKPIFMPRGADTAYLAAEDYARVMGGGER